MTQWSKSEPQALERLSALADGEIEIAGVAGLCAVWREEPHARASWHAYHLIGDVLRSEELSSHASHDAAFLRALRQRLASEPVVLAPMTAPVSNPARWRRFSTPVAVAAGFVAVAGVLLALQSPSPLPASATLASVPADTVPRAVANPVLASAAPVAVPPAEAATVVASGKLVRDARLDQYLAAHKQFGGSTALGVPSGFLRSATIEVPTR